MEGGCRGRMKEGGLRRLLEEGCFSSHYVHYVPLRPITSNYIEFDPPLSSSEDLLVTYLGYLGYLCGPNCFLLLELRIKNNEMVDITSLLATICIYGSAQLLLM